MWCCFILEKGWLVSRSSDRKKGDAYWERTERAGWTHWGGGVGRDGVDEEGRFDEEGLMRRELGRAVAGADVQGYDWGFQVAVCMHTFVRKRFALPIGDWTHRFQTKKQTKQTNEQNSLDETGPRSRFLRFHGRFVLLFPWRIVGAGAVAAFHFDVAGLVSHSAQDAHFGFCHFARVVCAGEQNLFLVFRLCNVCRTNGKRGSIEFSECGISQRELLHKGEGMMTEEVTVVGEKIQMDSNIYSVWRAESGENGGIEMKMAETLLVLFVPG